MSEDAMSRIRTLLAKCDDLKAAYRPRQRISEPTLTAWESRHGVTLPDEYRAFLREIGDGGTMPGHYCDFIVRPLTEVRGGSHAATPFPVTRRRLQERMRQVAAEGWPAEGVLFPELEPYWETIDQPPGCVVFGQYPSADALLLVTAGELRGSVWCGVCLGVPERARSGESLGFLAWFADTLDELLHGEFGTLAGERGESGADEGGRG